MAICKHCGGTYEADELVRHEHGSLVVVHCPDCNCTMGTWRDPALKHRR